MRSPFGDRSLIESVYSSFKQRTRIFFNNITSNPLNRSERFRRSMACWNLTIKLFTLYYNHLKEVKLSCHVQCRDTVKL
jgi:hypothetical protein